jgi:hypothetical protein
MNQGKLPVDISPDDYESVGAFLVALAKTYSDKTDRQVAISGPLQKLLDMPFVDVMLDDGTLNCGVIQAQFGQIAGLLLIQDDGGPQVGYWYARWWADSLVTIFLWCRHIYNTYTI